MYCTVLYTGVRSADKKGVFALFNHLDELRATVQCSPFVSAMRGGGEEEGGIEEGKIKKKRQRSSLLFGGKN